MGEVLKQYKAMEESGQDNPLLKPHSPRGTMEELCKAQLEKNNKPEENEKVHSTNASYVLYNYRIDSRRNNHVFSDHSTIETPKSAVQFL